MKKTKKNKNNNITPLIINNKYTLNNIKQHFNIKTKKNNINTILLSKRNNIILILNHKSGITSNPNINNLLEKKQFTYKKQFKIGEDQTQDEAISTNKIIQAASTNKNIHLFIKQNDNFIYFGQVLVSNYEIKYQYTQNFYNPNYITTTNYKNQPIDPIDSAKRYKQYLYFTLIKKYK